jgi:hypothetical protein
MADGDLRDERHQVVGDPARILADLPAGVGPDGVEVPQERDVPARIRLADVPQDLLDEELGAP